MFEFEAPLKLTSVIVEAMPYMRKFLYIMASDKQNGLLNLSDKQTKPK